MSQPDANNTATHKEPAWRSAANYIIPVDLGPHGMEGRWEQWWCREMEEARYELCCVPFFTYGFALGDVFEADESGVVRLVEKSGRSTLRFAFADAERAATGHEDVHAVLVKEDCVVEVSGPGLIAVDCVGETQLARLLHSLEPHISSGGDLLWEWGSDGPAPS